MNNPAGRNVGDCSVRAISAALGVDWETAFALIAKAAYQMADMPSSNSVWGDHPHGVYVLGFGNHVATVKDGIILDSWDSSNEIPQYYWSKGED